MSEQEEMRLSRVVDKFRTRVAELEAENESIKGRVAELEAIRSLDTLNVITKQWEVECAENCTLRARVVELEAIDKVKTAALNKIRFLGASDADTWISTAQEVSRSALDEGEDWG